MSDFQERWLWSAGQALDDIANVANLIWSVCLIGIVLAALMVAFGEVAAWVLFILTVLIVTALFVGVGFLWARLTKEVLARFDPPQSGVSARRTRPVLRFVLTSRAFRNLVTIFLAVSLVIVLAPAFEVAIQDALIGVLFLFAVALPLGPLTRFLLRCSGVNSADHKGQS